MLNNAAALTEATVEELDVVAGEVRALGARLARRVRPAVSLAAIDDLDRGIRMFTPVTGEASPIAPPLRYDPAEGGTTATVGRVTLGPLYEGHVGVAHGGIIALLLDEVLGTAATRRVWPSVTGGLSVRYRRPVPIGVPLVVTAAVVNVDGRRMTMHGSVCTDADPDTVLAEGEGAFIELSREQAVRMLGSDLRRLHGVPVPADAGDARR